MKTQLSERSDVSCLSEFDPTPIVIAIALSTQLVWGLIHTIISKERRLTRTPSFLGVGSSAH